MSQTDSVTPLVDGIKRGDEQAVQALWDQFFPQLCRIARQKLASQHRREADEEDVALSALASFCEAARNDRFPDLKDRRGLWQLLSQMTCRKAIDLIRHHQRARRGGGRVRGESALDDGRGGGIDQVSADELTPSLIFVLQEEVRQLLAALDEPQLRQMALLKLQGCTNQEIAGQFRCSVATVERRLQLIRKTWQAEPRP